MEELATIGSIRRHFRSDSPRPVVMTTENDGSRGHVFFGRLAQPITDALGGSSGANGKKTAAPVVIRPASTGSAPPAARDVVTSGAGARGL